MESDLATWQWIVVMIVMPVVTLLGKDFFEGWKERRKARDENEDSHLEDLRTQAASAVAAREKALGDLLASVQAQAQRAEDHVEKCDTDLAVAMAELAGLKGRMDGYERAIAMLNRDRREANPS